MKKEKPADKFEIFCPVCKKKRVFLRVTGAYIVKEPFTMDTVIGPRAGVDVQVIKHPTAYCESCKTVLYVGPSAKEVSDKLAREQERERKEEERNGIRAMNAAIKNAKKRVH